jgi:hypothetical protein
VVTGKVNMAIPSTIPQQLPPFSNVGDHPIAVTLGDNLTIVVSTNGILSVTPKVLL